MTEYDLTQTIAQYLDRHLIFPLLEFLDLKRDLYSEEDLLKAKLELSAEKTNMVDFAMDIYRKLHKCEDVPSVMKARREQVLNKLKQLQSDCGNLLKIVENTNLVKQLRSEKLFTMQYLEEHYQITLAEVDALYKYAKFQFDCGNYSVAAEYLYQFRTLNQNPDKSFSALWGKFAAEILMQNWEDALKDMLHLRDLIDGKNFTTPLKQLQQRTWLIHWSLFVFFNHPNGRNGIIDLFFF